ncbi:radical SAM family heme chaperone HemW [Dyella sp.]|jgi:oxygen-independent coproporphyrinogen-3 oxidase|uniref:radical SAM family heme chaperone HemW n=1 Tax=Dyella sp. TaxID=1869338 RepID=UPI002D77D481|nr:radical SAM family heme chaperone HemW [Dyella sp.]HET6431193.1 radical SAM family heme chaperone HemW [Dyella sp.]
MALLAPPLSLYVHMPWCVKKCPYCDFNSHGLRDAPPPYADYVDALLADLDADCADFGAALAGRPIVSVFFGGGTPSLFAPELVERFLDGARARLPFADGAEITLETNPGTVEHGRFDGYLAAGVNRLSFGIQSFDDDKLRRLGRIHSAAEAEAAVKSAQDAGYANINLDLMYALPQQTLDGALADVARALALAPAHISHYQLTLEPNTAFAANPPPLPDDDHAWAMQEACESALAAAGYGQYEISAYARPGRRCAHNLNYWQFGDYLGIGAGAHGKLSDSATGIVHRRWKTRLPQAFLTAGSGTARLGGSGPVPAAELPFEYMLNALRLIDGVPAGAFAERTGAPPEQIATPLAEARRRGWLVDDPDRLQTTALGQRFLNDVIAAFLD